MKTRLLLPLTLALFLLAGLPARALDKWLYHPTNLLVDKNVDELEPWWQYHVSVRVKTQDFHSQPEIKMLPEKADGASLNWNYLGVKPTQD